MKRKKSDIQYKFYCEENDNNFILIINDDELDEIHVGNALDKSWVVLGIGDLQKGLKEVGYSIVKREAN